MGTMGARQITQIFNWAGDVIIRDTVMWNKRAVLGSPNVLIPTDIREWITDPKSEVIQRVLKEIDLPTARLAGTFDTRAWRIWKYVAENVEYAEDKASQGLPDFWLFPAETITLKKGDCEDTSFLVATLMIASGISEQCVRVVLGTVTMKNNTYGHCWVAYQDESGTWCLVESTLSQVPDKLSPADPMTEAGAKSRYEPQFCLNSSHLWALRSTRTMVAEYVRQREERPGLGPAVYELQFF
jgi:transglutaminase-like putative cysteine protease